MRIVALYLFLYAAVLTCHVYGQDAEGSGMEARLREEAPLAWKRLEAKHDQTCFNWTQTSTKNARGKHTVRRKSGSDCYRGKDFQIRLREDGAVEEEVRGGNDRYLFTVTRSSDDSSWQLRHFAPRADNSGRNGFQTRLPWCIVDVPLSVLTADPSFKVESLVEKPDGSVDLRFSVNPQNINTDERTPDVTSGHVVLLPERDWAISAYEAKLTHPTKPDTPPVFFSASVVYGPEEDSFLNVVHTTYEFHWQADEGQRVTTCERDLKCQHSDLPVDSFTLAAFDVPEPALLSEASPRSRPWLLWLNIAGIVCLLVALILRSRLKARKA